MCLGLGGGVHPCHHPTACSHSPRFFACLQQVSFSLGLPENYCCVYLGFSPLKKSKEVQECSRPASSLPGRFPSLGSILALLPASRVVPGWALASSTRRKPYPPLSFLGAAVRTRK